MAGVSRSLLLARVTTPACLSACAPQGRGRNHGEQRCFRSHPSPSPTLPTGEGLQAGWSARLKLRFEATTLAGASRTVLRERSHVGRCAC